MEGSQRPSVTERTVEQAEPLSASTFAEIIAIFNSSPLVVSYLRYRLGELQG